MTQAACLSRVAEIEQALSVLVGLPWRGIGQAAGMGILDFADEVEVESSLHGRTLRARYSLHLLCPFRVAGRNLLMLGSDDLAVHGSKREHETRYDFLAAHMDERLTASPLVVRGIEAGDFGDVHLRFDHGVTVDVFVAGDAEESWRLVVRPEGEALRPTSAVPGVRALRGGSVPGADRFGVLSQGRVTMNGIPLCPGDSTNVISGHHAVPRTTG